MPRGRPPKNRTFTKDPQAYAAAATALEEADEVFEDAKIANSGAWKDAVADYEIDPSILKRAMKLRRHLNSNTTEVRDKARDYLRQRQICEEGLGIHDQLDLFERKDDREANASGIRAIA
jgi:hypothetical protein